MNRHAEPFSQIEDSFCIIWEKGKFSQVPLFEKEGKVYAKSGGGFIAIYNDGKTSKPTAVCKGINCKGIIWKDGVFGILEVQSESK
jgi:hypothetical protein